MATGLLAALVAGCGSGTAAGPAPVTSSGARSGAGWVTAAGVGPTSAEPSPATSGTATQGTAAGADAGGSTPAWAGPTTRIRVGDASVVAAVRSSSIVVHVAPDAKSRSMTLANPLPSGTPLTFLVQESKPGWHRVLLPVRPNQAQGWVRSRDVRLRTLDYRMTVSTGRHELTLYKDGRVVLRTPVGLGAGATPTPGGVFYVKELIRPRNPAGAYGPYAFGLSGYSKVLRDFAGGSGEIGIHGTNEPASVGRNVSHGCIRVRNEVITRLAGMLPLGVPVQIIA